MINRTFIKVKTHLCGMCGDFTVLSEALACFELLTEFRDARLTVGWGHGLGTDGVYELPPFGDDAFVVVGGWNSFITEGLDAFLSALGEADDTASEDLVSVLFSLGFALTASDCF